MKKLIKSKPKLNPKNKLYADNTFAWFLYQTIIFKSSTYLSCALSYLKLGTEYCKDCSYNSVSRNYLNCICEICGINDSNCRQNYCVCSLLEKHKTSIDSAIYLAKKYLDKKQKSYLRKLLYEATKSDPNSYEAWKIKDAEYALKRL